VQESYHKRLQYRVVKVSIHLAKSAYSWPCPASIYG